MNAATTRRERSIAASLDTPRALVPVLAQLFRGTRALGSEPRRLAGMLARAGVGPGSRVIELGCGKGALAVELAARTGCRVLGVDACAPFVAEARSLGACRVGGGRCRFVVRDVADVTGPARYDGAIMVGLYGVERARRVLRRLTLPGGVYLLDDAVRGTGASGAPRSIPTLAAARRLLASGGDTIIEEYRVPAARTASIERSLRRTLSRNARALARARPDLGAQLAEFLERQRRGADALARELVPVAWAVRRAGRRGAILS